MKKLKHKVNKALATAICISLLSTSFTPVAFAEEQNSSDISSSSNAITQSLQAVANAGQAVWDKISGNPNTADVKDDDYKKTGTDTTKSNSTDNTDTKVTTSPLSSPDVMNCTTMNIIGSGNNNKCDVSNLTKVLSPEQQMILKIIEMLTADDGNSVSSDPWANSGLGGTGRFDTTNPLDPTGGTGSDTDQIVIPAGYEDINWQSVPAGEEGEWISSESIGSDWQNLGLGLLGGIKISESASYTWSSRGPSGVFALADVNPKNPALTDDGTRKVTYSAWVKVARPNVSVVPPIQFASETYTAPGNYSKSFAFKTVEVVYRHGHPYPKFGWVKVTVNTKVTAYNENLSDTGGRDGGFSDNGDDVSLVPNTNGLSPVSLPELPSLGGGSGDTNEWGQDGFSAISGSNSSGDGGNYSVNSNTHPLDGLPMDGDVVGSTSQNPQDILSQAGDYVKSFFGGTSSDETNIGSASEFNSNSTANSSSNGGNSTGFNPLSGSTLNNTNTDGDGGSNSNSSSLFDNFFTGSSLNSNSNNGSGSSINEKLSLLLGSKNATNDATTRKALSGTVNTDLDSLIKVAENSAKIDDSVKVGEYDAGSAYTNPDDAWDLNRISKKSKTATR